LRGEIEEVIIRVFYEDTHEKGHGHMQRIE
jgi:hypothetical protein